jgi:chitinase
MFGNHLLKHLLAIFLLVAAPSSRAAAKKETRQPAQRQVIGYFTESGAASGQYPVKSIVTSGAAPLLTILNYAFGRVADDQCQIAHPEIALDKIYDSSTSVDGTADPEAPNTLRGTFHQLQELKRLYPQLKILISFGGWGQSGGFSSAVEPGHVQAFVRSCVDRFIEGHFAAGIEAPGIFDGIDIDWEYPVEGGVEPGHPQDKKNFTAMTAEFRRQFDAVRPGLLLTAALPAEEEYYKNFELKEISHDMDLISIMAYDLHWNTEPLTNFHSALFHDSHDPSRPPLEKRYGDYAVRGFLQAGVPAEKLIFGVPFYGKGWTGVKADNHGLYQSATGPAQSGGGYRELKLLPSESDRKYFSRAVTCTVWSKESFWSYDCPEAMRKKMDYIRRHHLRGVMFWELSLDSPDLELLHILAGK